MTLRENTGIRGNLIVGVMFSRICFPPFSLAGERRFSVRRLERKDSKHKVLLHLGKLAPLLKVINVGVFFLFFFFLRTLYKMQFLDEINESNNIAKCIIH